MAAKAKKKAAKRPARKPAKVKRAAKKTRVPASADLRAVRRALDDLSHRLGVMEDIQAIEELRARFARLADPQPAKDEIYKLFVEDGINEYRAGEKLLGFFQGHDDIRRLHETDPLLWRFHCFIPQEITVAPDRKTAKARWHLVEATKIPNRRTGKVDACWIMAKYDDDLVKAEGTWKFKHARMNVQIWVSHERGWAEKLVDLDPYMEKLG